jgi:hypothetical protein
MNGLNYLDESDGESRDLVDNSTEDYISMEQYINSNEISREKALNSDREKALRKRALDGMTSYSYAYSYSYTYTSSSNFTIPSSQQVNFQTCSEGQYKIVVDRAAGYNEDLYFPTDVCLLPNSGHPLMLNCSDDLQSLTISDFVGYNCLSTATDVDC